MIIKNLSLHLVPEYACKVVSLVMSHAELHRGNCREKHIVSALNLFATITFFKVDAGTNLPTSLYGSPVHYRSRVIRGGPFGVGNFASHFSYFQYFRW